MLRWIEGDNPVEGHLTAPGPLAGELAEFLLALWRIDVAEVDLADCPAAYRGGPLAEEHEFTLGAIEQVRGQIDAEAARAIWDDAMYLPARDGPATFVHADMMPGNVVTRDGRLAAVIDFGAAGIGDPSVDLIVSGSCPSGLPARYGCRRCHLAAGQSSCLVLVYGPSALLPGHQPGHGR